MLYHCIHTDAYVISEWLSWSQIVPTFGILHLPRQLVLLLYGFEDLNTTEHVRHVLSDAFLAKVVQFE